MKRIALAIRIGLAAAIAAWKESSKHRATCAETGDAAACRCQTLTSTCGEPR